MGIFKTPFSDTVGVDSVPKKGGKGEYDASVCPDVPGRDKGGSALAELTFDKTVSKGPSTSGPYKTPYKDSID